MVKDIYLETTNILLNIIMLLLVLARSEACFICCPLMIYL
jgi:hypothetical protein